LIAVRARQLVVRRNIGRGSRKPVACFRTHCGQCGSFPPNRRASCCPEVRYTQLLATCAGSFLALSMSALGLGRVITRTASVGRVRARSGYRRSPDLSRFFWMAASGAACAAWDRFRALLWR
jgi:hypothetical protein